MKFKCTKCGLCCRNIQYIPELKNYDMGNGICRFLDVRSDLCTIYDSRPAVCNIAVSYQLFFSESMSEEEYLKINYEGCKWLQEKRKRKVTN